MKRPNRSYRGRFAPSPTGALHAGSLVAALASWLDARAHQGRWIVRIEDVDAPRCVAGADRQILEQLSRYGLVSDEPPVWQSQRSALYQSALDRLIQRGWAYPCACTRKEIESVWIAQGVVHPRHAERPYPGTCRPERGGLGGRPARAWRLHLAALQRDLSEPPVTAWFDRRLGPQSQSVEGVVGDPVLRRADGLWAYQLAVVVDDADQGITDVVRGEDLADNTPRQIVLQHALGVPTPRHLHTPLVLDAHGEKLSKQTGAAPLPLDDPAAVLQRAATVLNLPARDGSVEQRLQAWVADWAEIYNTGL